MGVLVLRFTFIAALMVLSSCWMPVYNADVALATIAAGKLGTPDAEFKGQLSSFEGGGEYLAVPSRERPPEQISVVTLGYSQFNATTFLQSGGTWVSEGGYFGTTYDSAVVDPETVGLHSGFYDAVATPHSLVLLAFYPTVQRGQAVAATTSYSVEIFYPYTWSSPEGVRGVSVFPINSATVRAGVLTFDGTTLRMYSSDSTTASGVFLNTMGSPQWSAAYPGQFAPGWLAAGDTNTTTAPFYITRFKTDSSGLYLTEKLRFDGSALVELKSWKRTDRVVAYLTTGELLTRDGGYYHVCDDNGNIKFTFAAGRLRFAGEFYDNATSAYRCWFTSVLPEDASHSYGDATIRVYSLRTSKLDSLK